MKNTKQLISVGLLLLKVALLWSVQLLLQHPDPFSPEPERPPVKLYTQIRAHAHIQTAQRKKASSL